MAFSPITKRLAGIFLHHLENVVAFIRDISKHKQREDELYRQARHLKILHEIDQAILSTKSLPEIAVATLNQLQQILPCPWAGVMKFNFDNQEIDQIAVCAGTESIVQTIDRLPLAAYSGNLERLRQGKVHSVENLPALSDPPPILKALIAEGMRSYVLLPLITQDELVGVLNLGSDQVNAFDSDHITIAREIATSLAVMFQQSRLLKQNRQGRRRLQALSKQLLAIQERERRAIALELHDQIGQSLTAIKLNIQAAQRLPEVKAIQPHLSQNLSMVEQTLQQVRNLSLDLRPSMLDDLGLVAALRWYIDRQSRQAGIRAVFLPDMPQARLNADIETACFRVAQEALTNVVRYAQTDNVQIALKQQDSYLELFIRDEGVGFDATAALECAAQGRSLGLLGMQERVQLLGGHLEITSVPGQGSTIRATFPLSENKDGS